MKEAKVSLKSISGYSQSRNYEVPLLDDKESKADYEERTWRERCHYENDGQILIPPMQFKNCLANAGPMLSMKIPGRGTATYTKHFVSGILVMDKVLLPYKKDEIKGERLFVPSDGKKGGGKRVWKIFPYIPEWEGELTYHILDETITEKVFRKHLEESGNFVGLGRFRPQNGGYYGRFEVTKIEWK